jgi:hypothetical protein
MEKRTLTILAIRPQLNIAVDNATEIEKFQNLTLRPILKFQHNLLTFQFQMYIEKRKKKFRGMDISDQKKYIHHTIKTDNHFKNELIGMVIGLFTIEELTFFKANENELKRRISEMTIQRIQSVIDTL